MVIRTAILLWTATALHAQPAPQPPCDAPPVPAYSETGAAPAVKVWEHIDWAPSSCTGWTQAPSAMLIATAARFRFAESADGLRRRIGTVSDMTGLRYWSTTHQSWQTLILDAHAVAGRDSDRRRANFTLDEIRPGRVLYISQQDNLLGTVTYELRILWASADRIVFSNANVSAVRYLGLTLFEPGDLQSICFLDRESKDVWRYYNLTRMPKQAAVLTMGRNASMINRAVAVYRHLAGIPADQDPPAAR
jgi:hypothetical protein